MGRVFPDLDRPKPSVRDDEHAAPGALSFPFLVLAVLVDRVLHAEQGLSCYCQDSLAQFHRHLARARVTASGQDGHHRGLERCLSLIFIKTMLSICRVFEVVWREFRRRQSVLQGALGSLCVQGTLAQSCVRSHVHDTESPGPEILGRARGSPNSSVEAYLDLGTALAS